ncbi:MAG: hypothetical protein HC806_00945 [Anaerolineae bacterium]|nr:hypothetical protein [Anaerolineae bacterium]
MSNTTRELWLAFVAIVIITILYLFVVVTQGGIPGARDFFWAFVWCLRFHFDVDDRISLFPTKALSERAVGTDGKLAAIPHFYRDRWSIFGAPALLLEV